MTEFKNSSYHAQRDKLYIEKIRNVIRQLPPFCAGYFRSLELTTTPLTRYGYAIDLRGFFEYLMIELPEFENRPLPALTPADLDQLQVYHLEQYLSDMSLYTKDDRERTNTEQAKARKLSALRSFFKYCYRNGLISNNITTLLETPKLREKAIIRLEANEVADLLDLAENGDGLSERQKKYHEATKVRDVAILTMFLGTGIRISELVGLNLFDIDLENEAFLVTRKGGKEDVLNFGSEVAKALSDYLRERLEIDALEGHEQALFLSLQRRRITPRAVENLVKKYARIAAPLKKISPHKLRSTYGTMLYHETQDIYLVADVLGHKDVNTTRKHYAAASEENKRLAAKKIHLRQDE